MPNIVFASNNISHWPFAIANFEAGKYDAVRVPYGYELGFKQTITSPTFPAVAGEVTWIHLRMYCSNAEYTSSVMPELIRVRDADGVSLFVLSKVPATWDLVNNMYLYDGSGSDSDVQSTQFVSSTINGFDLRYESTSEFTNLKFYVNGGLVAECNLTGQSTIGPPATIMMGGAMVASGGAKQVMSEFIVADGDTRNARLNLLRPVTEGGETDWVGLATVLGDDDPTTGMTTHLADQRHTLSMSEYIGAANISSVVLVTQSYAGPNGPQNMRHTIRMGGANYDSDADIPLTEALEYNLTDFVYNPATSLPWIEADLDVLEVGFVSKT